MVSIVPAPTTLVILAEVSDAEEQKWVISADLYPNCTFLTIMAWIVFPQIHKLKSKAPVLQNATAFGEGAFKG